MAITHTASVNGMEMYYEVHGQSAPQGEPLVLLHGFTGSSADWKLLFPDPPAGFQLIIPDLRGHGRSTNPSMQFTHRQAALDVFALLEYLGVEHFKGIGISGGGNTLLHMATQQPSRIDTMVLVSATMYFAPQTRAIMAQFTAESRSADEWRIMRQSHHHGDDQIRALWAQAQAFKDSYDDMNFTPPHLSVISARTLIVYGDRDPLYPANMALEMYSAIPHSALWIIPNAGHTPVFGEMSGRFVETAITFLRGEGTQR